jgi:hypothetical protein
MTHPPDPTWTCTHCLKKFNLNDHPPACELGAIYLCWWHPGPFDPNTGECTRCGINPNQPELPNSYVRGCTRCAHIPEVWWSLRQGTDLIVPSLLVQSYSLPTAPPQPGLWAKHVNQAVRRLPLYFSKYVPSRIFEEARDRVKEHLSHMDVQTDNDLNWIPYQPPPEAPPPRKKLTDTERAAQEQEALLVQYMSTPPPPNKPSHNPGYGASECELLAEELKDEVVTWGTVRISAIRGDSGRMLEMSLWKARQ